ncbi:MAG TPA: hypothetical protein V6C64_08080 [Microcoleaceae cyanobacterium]
MSFKQFSLHTYDDRATVGQHKNWERILAGRSLPIKQLQQAGTVLY